MWVIFHFLLNWLIFIALYHVDASSSSFYHWQQWPSPDLILHCPSARVLIFNTLTKILSLSPNFELLTSFQHITHAYTRCITVQLFSPDVPLSHFWMTLNWMSSIALEFLRFRRIPPAAWYIYRHNIYKNERLPISTSIYCFTASLGAKLYRFITFLARYSISSFLDFNGWSLDYYLRRIGFLRYAWW